MIPFLTLIHSQPLAQVTQDVYGALYGRVIITG
jgi:hypothetical protein